VSVRWGIAGPGAIAFGFARGLAQLDDAELVAVGSRSHDRAAGFVGRCADRFATAVPYGSYEDLALDPSVDVVYVATPHSRHEQDTLLFLEAGKHVLCEKPFSLSEAQGRRMVEAARSRGLFLMEAMWSRFLPAYRTLAELLHGGAIGEPQLVEADFGFRTEPDPAHRLFDLHQGGGALLDLGVYPVQLSSLVLGAPTRVSAMGRIGETGVDEQVVLLLEHEGARHSVLKAALRTNLACTARIAGTDGWIEVPAFMHCPGSLTVVQGRERREIDAGWEGEGLRFQVQEVHRCLAAGLTESPVMTLDETLSIARTLDAARARIGLRYPEE
jgi:predicted dehydrogenase